jgi:hypothetical protein
MRDDCLEIMYLVSAMKNYLGCDHEEWVSLVKEAIEAEMAMLWTKVAIEFNENEDNDYFNGVWYKVGLELYKIDPVLAHFCFLYQGYGDEEDTAFEDWTDLGDDFEQLGQHYAAIEYYLYANLNSKRRTTNNNNDSDFENEVDELGKLLEKSKSQLKKGDRPGHVIYRTIYHSLKTKSLLGKLTQRKRDVGGVSSEYDDELIELIELIYELDTVNPVEGYRLVTKAWPKAFESPVCAGIHKGTIKFLRRGRLTPTSFNLILGALHCINFCDDDEEDEEIFEELQLELANDCNAMVVRQIKHCMRTSDFDSLTDILGK